MKLHYRRRQSGVSLVSAIIVMACIIIIGGIAVKVLLKLCDKLNPPAPPPGQGTNAVAQVEGFAGITSPGVWEAPTLKFAPLPAPAGQTAENPFGNAHLEVERSTNLVDWVTIAIFTNVPDVDLLSLETNRAPQAFFRGKFVYP